MIYRKGYIRNVFDFRANMNFFHPIGKLISEAYVIRVGK